MLVPNIVGVLRSMLVELDVLYSLLGWHLLGRGRFGYYLGYSGCAQQLLLPNGLPLNVMDRRLDDRLVNP